MPIFGERLGQRRRRRHGDRARDLGLRSSAACVGDRSAADKPDGRRSPALTTPGPRSLAPTYCSRRFSRVAGLPRPRWWTSRPPTARSPGSMPRSSAASRVMSDVTRCGPAWMCTTATRPSFSTWVTMPGKRLRADSITGDSSLGRRGLGEEAGEFGALDDPVAAALRRRARSRPSSAQRRTVSALTPSRSATWPTR